MTTAGLLGHPFRVLLWTAKGAALLHVAFTHGYSAAPGWGPSMLPTFLVDGQWFAVDRGARRGRGVAVGDCVLYAIPVVGAAERRYVLSHFFPFPSLNPAPPHLPLSPLHDSPKKPGCEETRASSASSAFRGTTCC